jgi:hypothetical protein
MALHKVREVGDAFHYAGEQGLYLFVRGLISLFVLALHVSYDLDRLRERLVAFSQTVQSFIDVHSLIVYPSGNISQRAAGLVGCGAGGAGLANFAASIGAFG